MNTNENTLTWKSGLFIGLGSFIGILGYGMVTALCQGMTIADSFVRSLPEAIGRTSCIVFVFGIFYFALNYKKH